MRRCPSGVDAQNERETAEESSKMFQNIMSLAASIDKGVSMVGCPKGGGTMSRATAHGRNLEKHPDVDEGVYIPLDITRLPQPIHRPTKADICKIANLKRRTDENPVKGEHWAFEKKIQENDFPIGHEDVTKFKISSESLPGNTLPRDKETLNKLAGIDVATTAVIGIAEVGMLVNDLAYKLMEQMLVTKEAQDEKERLKYERDVARSELIAMKARIEKANLATLELDKLKTERDNAYSKALHAMDELAHTQREMEILKKRLVESKLAMAIHNCEEPLGKSKEELRRSRPLSADQEEEVVQRFLKSPRFIRHVEQYAAPSFLYGFRVCRAQVKRMLKGSDSLTHILDGLDLQDTSGEEEPELEPFEPPLATDDPGACIVGSD